MDLGRRKILTDQVAGVILCGGKSSRMGQDKSRLILGEHTLLETTRRHLSAVCNMVYTAGGKESDFTDLYKEQGPAMALFSLLEQADCEDGARLLCMPVDMPLCSPTCLQAALDSSYANNTSVYALNAVMPLVLRYSRKGFAKLTQCASNSASLSLRGLLQCFDGQPVDLQAYGKELINVNDPDDWARLKAFAGTSD